MCAGSSIACNFVYNTLRIVQLWCTERTLKFEIGKLKFNCWNLKKSWTFHTCILIETVPLIKIQNLLGVS